MALHLLQRIAKKGSTKYKYDIPNFFQHCFPNSFFLAEMLEGENPCDGMSLGYCHFPQSQVVARHPFDKQLCQRTCKLDDLCMFWRHNEALAGTIEECLFLTSNYHQSMIVKLISFDSACYFFCKDCDAFASPVDGDIENCRAVNATSCYSILDEDCEYSGQRLSKEGSFMNSVRLYAIS